MLVEVKTRLQDTRLRERMESGPAGANLDVLVSLDKNASLSAHIGDAKGMSRALLKFGGGLGDDYAT
jgi:hypothetical protein